MAATGLKMGVFHSMPVGKLGIIAMSGCEDLVEKVNSYLVKGRLEAVLSGGIPESISYNDYYMEDYRVHAACPRFGTGEGKGLITQSVRGLDVYIICDCFNYGVRYEMYGESVPMSPDDHFQDLKRVISAIAGKARRITVIMTMLYEGRQHRRSARESLDCAIALQEISRMGVENIITFDAHDSRVQNAVPLSGFETVQPVYQMIKALVNAVPDIEIDREKLMVISPDEGGMGRNIYYSSVLGLELGMFYKLRDYTTIVNGRNPILRHEYLGAKLDGKDCLIVEDMISSGDSMIDVANQLKARNAGRIFVCSTFGLFVEGIRMFDEAYKSGMITKVFTTNLIYRKPELLTRPWYCEVDMSKYIAYIINTINHDISISEILNPVGRINNFLSDRTNRTRPSDK